MPQIKKTLWMIYHERPDGTTCLARNPEATFGFTDLSLSTACVDLLQRSIYGFNPKARLEDLLIDTRFPFEIDPEYVSVGYNSDRFQLPLIH